MKPALIIFGTLILILTVGYFATAGEETPNDQPSTVTAPSTPAATDAAAENTRPGTYTSYDENVLATTEADRILLFFHATWCPSCRALDQDIVANQANIPENVAIYRVDYDTATELKRKYGVTTQHSVVEIDRSGERIGDITHPLTLERLLNNL